MIAKVFALALVEQTSALCYPCQPSAIGPKVCPQTNCALLVQLAEMKNHSICYEGFCDGFPHPWFHGCFVYVNIRHFRTNAY